MCIDVWRRKLCGGDFLLPAINTYRWLSQWQNDCHWDSDSHHGIDLQGMGMVPPRPGGAREWTCHWQQGRQAGRPADRHWPSGPCDWLTGYWVHSVAAGYSAGSGPALPHRPQQQQVAPVKTAALHNCSCACVCVLELVCQASPGVY